MNEKNLNRNDTFSDERGRRFLEQTDIINERMDQVICRRPFAPFSLFGENFAQMQKFLKKLLFFLVRVKIILERWATQF